MGHHILGQLMRGPKFLLITLWVSTSRVITLWVSTLWVITLRVGTLWVSMYIGGAAHRGSGLYGVMQLGTW